MAAPIGDILSDFTISALEIIKRTRTVFVEDIGCSHPDELVSRLKIQGVLGKRHRILPISDESSQDAHFPLVDELVEQGDNFAILADKGLPCFIDPGLSLVQHLLAHHEKEIDLVPIGLSSALDGAIVLSGVDCTNFVFLGHYPDTDLSATDLPALRMPAIIYLRGDALLQFTRQVKAQLGDAQSHFRMVICCNIRQRINRKRRSFSLDEPEEHFLEFDQSGESVSDEYLMHNYVVVLYKV